MRADIEVRPYGSSDAPTVVLLHGGPGAIGSMRPLAEMLSDDWQVLEPLQRRAGEVPVTVESHVDDLVAVLPGPVPLVGHSWGAMLALSFTVAHPELVTSLVLVGCGAYSTEGHEVFHTLMRARLGGEGVARLDAMRRAQDDATDSVERGRIFTEIGDESVRAQAYDPMPFRSDLPADPVGHDQTWSDVMRRQHEGIEPAAFAAITVPVTMLHGDEDPHVGSIIHDTLAAHIAQLRFVGLPRCGHTPWIERYASDPFLTALQDAPPER